MYVIEALLEAACAPRMGWVGGRGGSLLDKECENENSGAWTRGERGEAVREWVSQTNSYVREFNATRGAGTWAAVHFSCHRTAFYPGGD